ncbi:hypothetical protein [Mucilaginibacter sp.]|uniref:hypothetical protein n=1 Tax=Mucilaginibacter sp. TaxID=1882438 RepID=UPI0035BBD2BD
MEILDKKSRRTFVNFIGIDVSKNKFDVAILTGSKLVIQQTIPNTQTAILEWLIAIKATPELTRAKTLYCMEQQAFIVICSFTHSERRRLILL